MSTTLNDFNAKVQEIREKIKNEPDNLQKRQAFLQSLKEHCARTLEQATMDSEFEETVKTVLLKVQSDLSQLKRQGISKATAKSQSDPTPASTIPAAAPITPSSQPPEKQSFRQGTDLPSDFAPITESNDMLQTVPTTAFDPASSPILRRLLNKQPIVDAKAIPPSGTKSETETESAVKIAEKQEPIAEVPKFEQKSPFSAPEPIPTDQVTPFPNSPFPTSPNNKPIIPRKSISLEIPQLKIKMDFTFTESILAFGREDFENSTQSMKLPPDFFSPMLNKKNIPNAVPSEHFAIEQRNLAEFLLKDRANMQKTFFKNTFVNDHGTPIADGETFVLPVLINKQTASLTVIFRIKP